MLALTLQEGDGYVDYFLKPESMYQDFDNICENASNIVNIFIDVV